MAEYYSQPMLSLEALTGQYSVLYQERLYLLDSLAEEESQGERLTQALMSLQAQVQACEASGGPQDVRRLKQLRQQVKSVRHRIGACQNRERALAMNISSVVAQMEGVKRYQYINAQQDYAIQLHQAQQHAQMVLMSPARPAFAVRSPANFDLAARMQYMALAPSAEPVFGNRASLDPYMGTPNQPAPYATPTYTGSVVNPVQAQNIPAWGSPMPWTGLNNMNADARMFQMPTPTASHSCASPTTQDWSNAKAAVFSRQRASTMLETVPEYHQSSDQRHEADSALRRLSLLDGNAALKLEREAAGERARELAGWHQ